MVKKLSIELTDKQHLKLKVAAAKEGKSIKQMIIDALGL